MQVEEDTTQAKIRSFTDLQVWKDGHMLVLKIYELTRNFPSDEIFGITNQLRRAAVSFTSNIAEGFSKISYKEKIHVDRISLGSLTEMQNQWLIAKDIQYLPLPIFKDLAERTVLLSKMLNGLIKKSKKFM